MTHRPQGTHTWVPRHYCHRSPLMMPVAAQDLWHSILTFFLRPPRGPRLGARATVFFSGVKSWVERQECQEYWLPCQAVPRTGVCSPGRWSSLTQMGSLNPLLMGTHWPDPGHWRLSELV